MRQAWNFFFYKFIIICFGQSFSRGFRTEVLTPQLKTSCIELVYGTMIRVSEKWKKIKMTEYELTILRNLLQFHKTAYH